MKKLFKRFKDWANAEPIHGAEEPFFFFCSVLLGVLVFKPGLGEDGAGWNLLWEIPVSIFVGVIISIGMLATAQMVDKEKTKGRRMLIMLQAAAIPFLTLWIFYWQ